MALAACGADSTLPKIDAPRIRLAGYVAADEPRAVKVAQDMLAQGGTVADAGVALALTLTVTLPSRASLGGGGACLVRNGRDPTNDQRLFTGGGMFGPAPSEDAPPTQSVEFLPRAGREGGALGLPTLARGLYTIHAKYGKLRWEQIVAGAENMARFGVPVSRALTNDIATARAEITGPSGKPLTEGDVLPQGELSDSLAALRTHGAGDLYIGKLATEFVAGAGGAISAAALREVAPKWQELKGVPFGNNVAYFSATPGGEFAEKLWRSVNSEPASTDLVSRVLSRVSGNDPATDVVQRAVAIADKATGLLAAPIGAATPTASAPGGTAEVPSAVGGDAATGFVVVDYRGSALACTLTMGRLFGAGRLIGQTGILGSLPVPGPSSDGLSGAVLLVTNENVRKLLGAFAAGGDRSGPQSMVATALNVLASPQSLEQAMTTPRLYAAGSGRILAEPGLPLGQRTVTETDKLGAVNGVACAGGLPGDDRQCVVQADPRGAGVTATAERKR